MQYFPLILLILQLLRVVTCCQFIWSSPGESKDIPPTPKQKIKRKYEEHCKDVSKKDKLNPHQCSLLKDMLDGGFKRRLEEGQRNTEAWNDFVDYWNNQVIDVLDKVFEGEFREKYEDGFQPIAGTLYLFDPIYDDSTTDYTTFSGVAILAVKLAREINDRDIRKKTNFLKKIKGLNKIVSGFCRDIENAANNVESTKSWKLSNLYEGSPSPMQAQVALCTNYVKEEFKKESIFRNYILSKIEKYEEAVNKIDAQNLKESLTSAMDIYGDFIWELYDGSAIVTGHYDDDKEMMKDYFENMKILIEMIESKEELPIVHKSAHLEGSHNGAQRHQTATESSKPESSAAQCSRRQPVRSGPGSTSQSVHNVSRSSVQNSVQSRNQSNTLMGKNIQSKNEKQKSAATTSQTSSDLKNSRTHGVSTSHGKNIQQKDSKDNSAKTGCSRQDGSPPRSSKVHKSLGPSTEISQSSRSNVSSPQKSVHSSRTSSPKG